jgi:hypothetical protein
MGTGGGRCSSNSDRLSPKFERNNISSYADAGVLSSLTLLRQEAQKKYVGRVPQLRRVCRDRMLRGCPSAGNASQSSTLSRITYPSVPLSSGYVFVTKLRFAFSFLIFWFWSRRSVSGRPKRRKIGLQWIDPTLRFWNAWGTNPRQVHHSKLYFLLVSSNRQDDMSECQHWVV